MRSRDFVYLNFPSELTLNLAPPKLYPSDLNRLHRGSKFYGNFTAEFSRESVFDFAKGARV